MFLRMLVKAVIAVGIVIALIVGMLIGVWARDALAHPCIGRWRVEQTQSALEDGFMEPPRATLYDEVFCDAVHTTVTPRKPSGVVSAPSQPVSAGVEQWRGLVSAYFPPEQVNKALSVMQCESGGNPNAKNPNSSASGLFQWLWRDFLYWANDIMGLNVGTDARFDPTISVAVSAYRVAVQDGWRGWTCG